MLVFGTLGPAGSNHEWVTKRYLAFHGLGRARLDLFSDFERAFERMFAGDIDYIIQVAVHASVPDTVARFRDRAHLIDTFIAPSQPMAVLTRTDVDLPRSLGLQMATREYVDTSRWAELVAEPSTIDVGQGLLSGKYDSGITLIRYAEEYPDRLKLDQTIGAVVDPWLVYGKLATVTDQPLIWPDSPAAQLFRISKFPALEPEVDCNDSRSSDR
jgi:hypothetical protein